MEPEVLPAILVKTRPELLSRILLVKDLVRTIQIDVMDNVFVPNKTVGIEDLIGLPPLPKGVRYEFHWMVKNPERWIVRIDGPWTHIVHVETIESAGHFADIRRTVQASGGKLALALNPETPLENLGPFIKNVKMVLVMTVHPGFSGQKYIYEMGDKTKALRAQFPNLDIEVDGGINLETIGHACSNGANMLAAASAIFSSVDIPGAIKALRKAAKSGIPVIHDDES